MATITKKPKEKIEDAPEEKPVNKPKAQKKEAKKELSITCNEFKTFEGKQYTGMQIGRSHHWSYDAGDRKETRITPGLWEISYAVTKRRKGHAPEGSGELNWRGAGFNRHHWK